MWHLFKDYFYASLKYYITEMSTNHSFAEKISTVQRRHGLQGISAVVIQK